MQDGPIANGRRLRRFMRAHGVTVRSAAAVFAVAHPTIVGWTTGVAPRAEHREAIERWTCGAVTAVGWQGAAERRLRSHLSLVSPLQVAAT